MVVVPDVRAVTKPVKGFTDATVGALLVQPPPAVPLVLNWAVKPGHRVDDPLMVPALALGLTDMVNEMGEPVHPFNDGVTVMVAVTALMLLLVAVKAPMLPVPFRPKPTLVELVQL